MTTSTITTLVRLNNTPETSRVIGWLTSQERLAYNQAVNVLNREPHIPKRAQKGSRHGLNKRITRWRKEELAPRDVETRTLSHPPAGQRGRLGGKRFDAGQPTGAGGPHRPGH